MCRTAMIGWATQEDIDAFTSMFGRLSPMPKIYPSPEDTFLWNGEPIFWGCQ